MNEGCKDCIYFKNIEKRVDGVETAVKTQAIVIDDNKDRLTKVEVKVDTTNNDIKEIKDHQSKMMFYILGIMGTSIVSLLILVFNITSK